MAPNKRHQVTSTLAVKKAPRPPSPVVSPPQMLPLEILVEVAARSDATTLVRIAATCKFLHRQILTLDFVSRICCAPPGLLPMRVHSYLNKNFCLQEHTDAAAAAKLPSAKKKKKHLDGFVCWRSWSWAALSTRCQDDEANRVDEHWRQAMKTSYIDSCIFS
ncbi:unnamed protein product [Urochloa humidicola]